MRKKISPITLPFRQTKCVVAKDLHKIIKNKKKRKFLDPIILFWVMYEKKSFGQEGINYLMQNLTEKKLKQYREREGATRGLTKKGS